MTTGERLKGVFNELKLRKKITQEHIADSVGLSKSALSKMVSDHSMPSEPLLAYLYRTHKVGREYILEGRGPVFNEPEILTMDQKLDLIIKQNKQILKELKTGR